jgi:hypothetical protein
VRAVGSKELAAVPAVGSKVPPAAACQLADSRELAEDPGEKFLQKRKLCLFSSIF